MKLNEICGGLRALLERNHYTEATIKFYEREWRKINKYLTEQHGTDEFTMEYGLKYLENQYGIITKYADGSITQQRVQLIRVVHMLEDFQLHGVLINRYSASKNPICLNDEFQTRHTHFKKYMDDTDLSKCTKKHYSNSSLVFLDYLQQKSILDLGDITIDICHKFIQTFSGYSYKTIEQRVCGLRFFLRYLFNTSINKTDLAEKIHVAPVSKSAKIPSAWTGDELKAMISTIDRNSRIGKRDYAMILLACIMGLRSGDIKRLEFDNFDWTNKTVSFVQHKTRKLLELPLPESVGWAVIDYIKNARPEYHETKIIFIKHMPPFEPFPDEDHLSYIVKKYMNKAGLGINKDHHKGFHSLRHSAASIMLENDTQLPVISTILGHTDIDVTSVYLKKDIEKLKECVLSLDFESEVHFDV